MKFYATFKTPDAATHEGFLEQAEKEVMRAHCDEQDALTDDACHINPEREDLVDVYNGLAHHMAQFASKWAQYGEYVTLEFDDETGACVVTEARR